MAIKFQSNIFSFQRHRIVKQPGNSKKEPNSFGSIFPIYFVTVQLVENRQWERCPHRDLNPQVVMQAYDYAF